MSHLPARSQRAVCRQDFFDKKAAKEKISMITCYDAAFARLIENSAIDSILVGDSMGNVVLGFQDTIPVTVDHIVHHTAAVRRAVKRPFLIADMPFLSAQISPQETVRNAGRLIQEGGAQAVKIEGGAEVISNIKAVIAAGIPVVGHLGLTPQSVHALSGYKVQGKRPEAAKKLVDDAKLLDDCGVMAIVLELIPAALATSVTESVKCAVIGIGAGAGCDGQVLVLHDMLGFQEEFKPRFLKRYLDLEVQISKALNEYHEDVVQQKFPTQAHSFGNSET